MYRTLVVVMSMLCASATAQAQGAICDCCNVPYTVPGADWIGLDRTYGGLCENCYGFCLDCRGQRNEVRDQDRFFDMWGQQPERTDAERQEAQRMRDRLRQRWEDLRYSCYVGGGRDIGPLNAGGPASPPPTRGLDKQTKDRFRDYAQQVKNEYEQFFVQCDRAGALNDPTLREEIFDVIREWSGKEDVFNRLADDPPDPDFDKVVKPEIVPEPKDDGKPKEVLALRRAAAALKNSNAYFNGYITSFERYQGAQAAKNKDAAKNQIRAMGHCAHHAEAEARKATRALREFERTQAKRTEDFRAELTKKGVKWQDELTREQEKLRDGWPADEAKAFEKAKVSDKVRDALRKKTLALTPETVEKDLAARRAAIEVDDAIAKALDAAKIKTPWPEVPQLDAMRLMHLHANLLHAEVVGKKRTVPEGNPYPPAEKTDKK